VEPGYKNLQLLQTNASFPVADLSMADEIRWYLLNGRLVGIGVEQQPLSEQQPVFAVARFGAQIRYGMFMDGVVR
jgi:hypothetical protein